MATVRGERGGVVGLDLLEEEVADISVLRSDVGMLGGVLLKIVQAACACRRHSTVDSVGITEVEVLQLLVMSCVRRLGPTPGGERTAANR